MNNPSNTAELNDTNSLYSRLGGEVVLREFVDRLYGYMDSTPEVKHIREMFSGDLCQVSDKLFLFLSGMLGGPPLYIDEFGPPRLRHKHRHLDIGEKECEQWLSCARYAVDQLDIDGHLREELMINLTVLANHLKSKDTDMWLMKEQDT